MPENTPLQRRGGLNIGVEPAQQIPFLQDAGGKQFVLNPTVGAEHIILECPEGKARSPLFYGGEVAGIIHNETANSYFYNVYFRDTLGNEIPLHSAPVEITSFNTNAFTYHDGRLAGTGFTLTPGEVLVLKTEADPGP